MNLNQVTIPSVDVKAATDFYCEIGLNIIVDALPRYVRLECPEGQATLSIHKVNAVEEGDGIVIYFEHDDLDNHVNNLQEKGIIFNQLPEDKPWLWREATLIDPDGHKIIIYSAGRNRKNPPWRIN